MCLFQIWCERSPVISRPMQMPGEAVCIEPYSLKFIPNHLNIQCMCVEAVRIVPHSLEFSLYYLKNQEICNEEKGIRPASDLPCFLSATISRTKSCVLEQLRKTHGVLPMSLITLLITCVMLQCVESSME